MHKANIFNYFIPLVNVLAPKNTTAILEEVFLGAVNRPSSTTFRRRYLMSSVFLALGQLVALTTCPTPRPTFVVIFLVVLISSLRC